jgi:hypothetical protein
LLHDVMISCPTTQLPLPTGVQLSPDVFATAVFLNVRVQCPHCEMEHRWSKSDAFLQEAKREAYGLAATPRFFTGGRRPGRPAQS